MTVYNCDGTEYSTEQFWPANLPSYPRIFSFLGLEMHILVHFPAHLSVCFRTVISPTSRSRPPVHLPSLTFPGLLWLSQRRRISCRRGQGTDCYLPWRWKIQSLPTSKHWVTTTATLTVFLRGSLPLPRLGPPLVTADTEPSSRRFSALWRWFSFTPAGEPVLSDWCDVDGREEMLSLRVTYTERVTSHNRWLSGD